MQYTHTHWYIDAVKIELYESLWEKSGFSGVIETSACLSTFYMSHNM